MLIQFVQTRYLASEKPICRDAIPRVLPPLQNRRKVSRLYRQKKLTRSIASLQPNKKGCSFEQPFLLFRILNLS